MKIDTVELFDEEHLNGTTKLYCKENSSLKDSVIDYWSRFYSKYLLFFQLNPHLPVNECQIRSELLLTGEFQWLTEESFSDYFAIGMFQEDKQLSLVSILAEDDHTFKLFIVGLTTNNTIYDVHYRKVRFSKVEGSVPFLETEGSNLDPFLFKAQRSKESMIPMKLLSLQKTLELRTQQVYKHAST